MFCKSCGKEIDDNSTFCAHCGQKILKEDKPNGCIIAFVIIFGVFLLLFIFGSLLSSTQEETPIEQNINRQKSDAKYYCHETVKNRLKNPRDAKFAPITEIKFNELGEMRYELLSYVYATNSFSAITKSEIYCIVKIVDKEHGYVEKLEIN